jgi:hypothetical protein
LIFAKIHFWWGTPRLSCLELPFLEARRQVSIPTYPSGNNYLFDSSYGPRLHEKSHIFLSCLFTVFFIFFIIRVVTDVVITIHNCHSHNRAIDEKAIVSLYSAKL